MPADVPGIDYVQVVQNAGRQAGARTDHLCIDLYELPQIPHRLTEELGGAARYLIREGVCPWCRLVRDEVARRDRRRVPGRLDGLLRALGVTLAVRAVGGAAAPRGGLRARHGRAAGGRRGRAPGGAARAGACSTTRPTTWCSTRRPLKERVDETYHWHWEVHPRLREIAGLELGTGCPSTR